MIKMVKYFLSRVVPLMVLVIFLVAVRSLQAGIESPPKPEKAKQEANVPTNEPVAAVNVLPANTPTEKAAVPPAGDKPATVTVTPPASQPAVAPTPPAELVQTPAATAGPAVLQPVAEVAPPPAPTVVPEATPSVSEPPLKAVSDDVVAKSSAEKGIKEKDVESAKSAPLAVEDAPAVSAPTAAATTMEYQGVYKSGNAPLKERTKVRIYRSGDAYFFAHREESGSWSIQLESTRGAQATGKGVWFYWFDAGDNTLHAYFEVSNSQQLASEINAAVAEFHEKNSGIVYKQRYEEYRSKALEQAR